MTRPVSTGLLGMIGPTQPDLMSGLNLVVALTALVAAVNGAEPDAEQIAAALAEDGLPSGPADVTEVLKECEARRAAPMEITETEDDSSWGDEVEDLPAEIRDRLSVGPLQLKVSD
jgi:hypothetical protein